MAQRREHRIPTGHRADQKRLAIITAAREVFLRDGFEVPVDTIAAVAGVSKVTIYHHFGSKEALFVTVVDELIRQTLATTLAEARQRLADADDPREALLWTVRAWVAESTTPEALALRHLVGQTDRRFPELNRTWTERGPGRFHVIITEAFERFVDRGQLVIPDIGVAVQHLYALSLYPHLVAESSGATLDADLTERLITSGVDMLLSYYRAQDTA